MQDERGGSVEVARAALALTVAGLLVLAAIGCGGDDDGDATGEAGEPAAESGIEIDLAGLSDRCQELAEIATELRGEEPETITQILSPPGGVILEDEPGYEASGCVFAYGDADDFLSREEIRFEGDRPLPERADDPEVRAFLWDSVPADREIDGLGDAAKYYAGGFGPQRSETEIHVLVGNDVVRIKDLRRDVDEDEAVVPEDAMVEAARELLDRLAQ